MEEVTVPFYFVRGNHRSDRGDRLLDTQNVVTTVDTAGVSVESKIRIFGLDHDPEGEISLDVLPAPETVAEPFSILLLHQTLRQLSGEGIHHVDLRELGKGTISQYDYILSGHHHDAACTDWNGTSVLYTGAAENMSTNTAATDRVAWVLSVDGDSTTLERYDIP